MRRKISRNVSKISRRKKKEEEEQEKDGENNFLDLRHVDGIN